MAADLSSKMNHFPDHQSTDPIPRKTGVPSLNVAELHKPEAQPLTQSAKQQTHRSSLRRSTTARKHKDKDYWKKRAQIILPHVGLVCMSILYTTLGGIMFYAIEHPNEMHEKRMGLAQLRLMKREISEALWSRSGDSKEQFKDAASEQLDQFALLMFRVSKDNLLTAQDLLSGPNATGETSAMWTYPSAIFFSTTVITTIGYGHLVPRTTLGRVACIVFAIFGIPLILVTVSDMGKFMAEITEVMHNRYYSGLVWLFERTLGRCFRAVFTTDLLATLNRVGRRPQTGRTNTSRSVTTSGGGLGSLASDIESHKVPVIFSVLVWLSFNALMAGLMCLIEDWSFLKSFYYSFTTVTTIGFGDIYPQRDSYLSLTAVIIVLGLIITTMCIDLVGSQYILKIHYLGRDIRHLRHQLYGVGDMIRMMTYLQKTHGLTRSEIERLANCPDELLWQLLLSRDSALMEKILGRPFAPSGWRQLKWIDSRASDSNRSYYGLCSVDSFELYYDDSTNRTSA